MKPARTLIPLVLAALALPACGGTSDEASAGGDGSGGKVSLVAYSTPREVYEKVIPAFTGTTVGRGVGFTQSYGASGDQARAVLGGLPADVVALSLAPDVGKLVDEGLVAPDWANDEFDGFVSKSVVVIGVRKGNPKNIKGWDDLIKPGVEVLTPNPFTSGGARWNVMAAFGARDEDYLKKLFENVVVQDKSARESLQTFVGGKGDAILAYENEMITVRNTGEELEYVIPDETILIENPIAVLAKSKNPQKAKAFVDYARSPEGQKVFAEKGYRSILEDLADEKRYPTPSGLFTVEKFGGWEKVMKDFFDPESSVMQRIESGLGVSTES
jgi:sulfate transport system substrate-binding protein